MTGVVMFKGATPSLFLTKNNSPIANNVLLFKGDLPRSDRYDTMATTTGILLFKGNVITVTGYKWSAVAASTETWTPI